MTFPAIDPALDPNLFDWILVAWGAVFMPFLAVRSIRRLRRRVAAGESDAKVRGYRVAIIEQWIYTAVLLGGFWFLQRQLSDIGLVVRSDGQALAAWGLAGAGAVVMALQMQAVATRRSARDQLRKQIGDLSELLPTTRRELRHFSALSVTAGINEEIVYRGYYMAILWHLGGPWLAVVGSVVIFTAGHSYQPKNLPKVAFIGLVMSLLYLLGGSVFPLMLLHAALDLAAGWMTWRVSATESAPAAMPA